MVKHDIHTAGWGSEGRVKRGASKAPLETGASQETLEVTLNREEDC